MRLRTGRERERETVGEKFRRTPAAGVRYDERSPDGEPPRPDDRTLRSGRPVRVTRGARWPPSVRPSDLRARPSAAAHRKYVSYGARARDTRKPTATVQYYYNISRKTCVAPYGRQKPPDRCRDATAITGCRLYPPYVLLLPNVYYRLSVVGWYGLVVSRLRLSKTAGNDLVSTFIPLV